LLLTNFSLSIFFYFLNQRGWLVFRFFLFSIL